jgi:hypothetical protein
LGVVEDAREQRPAYAGALVARVDGEEPEEDVLVVGVAAILDARGTQPADDRSGPGGEEAGDVLEEGPRRRRIAAGREGDGDAGQAALPEDPVDRPAVAMNDADGSAVIAQQDAPPMTSPTGPDGKPAGVVEQGVGDDASGLGILAGFEGAYFQARNSIRSRGRSDAQLPAS